MIQPYSRVNVADNTGAKEAACIRVLHRGRKDYAEIGDMIVVSVKSATPRGMVKKKEVLKGIVVRQTKPIRRKDGSSVRFDDNAIVLINDDGTPRGTRVFGPIAREIRDRGYIKVISMAQEVL